MSPKIRRLAWRLWLPVVLIALWWTVSLGSTSPYFPPLPKIIAAVGDLLFSSENLREHVGPTLVRFISGYVLALVLGISLGIALGLMRTARLILMPVLDFCRAIPPPTLLPIAIVLLGVDDGMKIGLIAVGAVWPILLNTMAGVAATDEAMLEMSRVYGLSARRRLGSVIVPGAWPPVFAGARISLAISLILVVLAEMQASTNGIGYLALLSQQTFDIPQMWAGIVVLGLIGLGANLIFVAVESKAIAWHRGWRAAAAEQ